ncbi:MAG: hypothetical protein ABIP75_11800 [Pyrinomonadaceae bacterium]
MNRSPLQNLVILFLRAAFLLTAAWVIWTVYRGVPETAPPRATQTRNSGATTLRLRLTSREAGRQLDVPVRLFPLDLYSAQREFNSEQRPGLSFADFIQSRMDGRAPVEARFDPTGRVTLRVAPGEWWIYVTLPGETGLEWQEHVNVAGNDQTVELNDNNIFTRTRSF